MHRFTIRELVLITAIVAISVGWWVDRRRSAARDAIALDKADARAAFLLRTLEQFNIVVEELNGGYVAYPRPKGKVMDEYVR